MTEHRNTLDDIWFARADLIDYAARLTGDLSTGEDLVQDAFVRYANAPNAPHRPIGYLKRIVRNLALDLGRRKSRERRLYDPSFAAVNSVADTRPGPEATLVSRERVRRVSDAFHTLPEQTRRALQLYRFEEKTLQDIADILGVSVSTAHRLVHCGLESCRVALLEGDKE